MDPETRVLWSPDIRGCVTLEFSSGMVAVTVGRVTFSLVATASNEKLEARRDAARLTSATSEVSRAIAAGLDVVLVARQSDDCPSAPNRPADYSASTLEAFARGDAGAASRLAAEAYACGDAISDD